VLRGEQSYLIRNLRGAQYSAYREPWRRWFVLALFLFGAVVGGLYLADLWAHPNRNMTIAAAAVALFGAAAGWSIWNNFGYTATIAAIAESPKPQDETSERIERVEMFFAPFERTAIRFCALINERIEFQRAIDKLAAEIRVGGVDHFSAVLDDKLQAAERGDISPEAFQQFVRACVDELGRRRQTADGGRPLRASTDS
jgi:hypothetical protein